VAVASDALTRLEWRQCPALAQVQLDCCSLEQLVFADCDRLQGEALLALSDAEAHGGQQVGPPARPPGWASCCAAR
jgi:hypothetical protein